MQIDLKEAIIKAELSLRAVTKIGPKLTLIQLFDRLATISKVMSISVNETLAACRAFEYDINDWARFMADEGETDVSNDLRCIALDLHDAWFNGYRGIEAAERADRKNWGVSDVVPVCYGRWESRDGKYFVELWSGRYSYCYRSNYDRGTVCDPRVPIESARAVIQSMIARGRFVPDRAICLMKRVAGFPQSIQ